MKNKKYLYSLSKICSLLAGFMLFILAGCNEDEILLEEPIDFIAPENAYKTVNGIEQGINALYCDTRQNYFCGAGEDTEHWRGVGLDTLTFRNRIILLKE
jgi:hypothetical protein